MPDFLLEPFGYRFPSFHAIAKMGMAGIGGIKAKDMVATRSRSDFGTGGYVGPCLPAGGAGWRLPIKNLARKPWNSGFAAVAARVYRRNHRRPPDATPGQEVRRRTRNDRCPSRCCFHR
jgi:hypothetical protein